jgi:oxalate decarboxylase/phosphoglucose isomerase-like protein (cupin superfamily)
MTRPIVSTSANYQSHEFDWGTLTWFVSRELKNCESMTVGRCVLKTRFSNPRHIHPNCDEVLHLISGRIICGVGENEFTMGPGDTITIPTSLPHYAKNIGIVDAIMLICFSSADRQSIIVEESGRSGT